jgi:hypothetical protein
MIGSITAVPLQDGIGGILVPLVFLGVIVVPIAGMWVTFSKANEPGWAAIIPIYNLYVMLKIGDNAWWWLLVILFVPIVQLYGLYKMYRGVADAFGQGVGFTLGLIFLGFIFFPLLGFGEYTYRGNKGMAGGGVR